MGGLTAVWRLISIDNYWRRPVIRNPNGKATVVRLRVLEARQWLIILTSSSNPQTVTSTAPTGRESWLVYNELQVRPSKMDRLIDTRCTENQRPMIHYLTSFLLAKAPYFLSVSPSLETIVVTFLLVGSIRVVNPSGLLHKEEKANSCGIRFKFKQLQGECNWNPPDECNCHVCEMQSMLDSFPKKKKIYIYIHFSFCAVKFSIWNDDRDRGKKCFITPASNPARNRKGEKELKINLW